MFFNLSHHFSRLKKWDQHEPSALAPVPLHEIMHVWSFHYQFMFVLTHLVDVIAQITSQKAKLKTSLFPHYTRTEFINCTYITFNI